MPLRVDLAAERDGVLWMTLSAARFAAGPPVELRSGERVAVLDEHDRPGWAYVLLADPDTDTLTVAATITDPEIETPEIETPEIESREA